jgi:hypothetical protein
LQLFDLVELARDTRSDKGGEAKWVHPCGALVKEFAKRIAALAQSDAEPKGIDLDDADRAYDKWAEHRNGQSRLDAFRAGVEFGLRHTALAQSDASAGLIEAAKIAEEHAGRTAGSTQYVLEYLAAMLRTRAADRSGK